MEFGGLTGPDSGANPMLDPAEDSSVLLGPEEVFVHWTPSVADAVPEVVDAIAGFKPIYCAAGWACAAWLRDRALREPHESATRLLLKDGAVLGFYALANGAAQLARRDREELEVRYVTQPAVILTQIARAEAAPGVGETLLLHAIGVARRSTQYSAATVFALDPHDDKTSEMWRERGFRESELGPPGRDDGPKRLWIPLGARD